MRNVVTFHEPAFKPMPGELTADRIREATLPVKVEAAKRAIAACCDLSELLTWKDKLSALAAAAKMAKMPDLARDVNRVHKEAFFRMAQILQSYKGPALIKKADGRRGGRESTSERLKAAHAAGIPKSHMSPLSRLAKAPQVVADSIIADDRIPPSPTVMARSTPRNTRYKSPVLSDAGNIIFFGLQTERRLTSSASVGFVSACSLIRRLDLSAIPHLTPEEKQRTKKLIIEMQEIFDEMDRRMGCTDGETK